MSSNPPVTGASERPSGVEQEARDLHRLGQVMELTDAAGEGREESTRTGNEFLNEDRRVALADEGGRQHVG